MALPKPAIVRRLEPDDANDSEVRGHSHARATLTPHGGRYDDILDAIGHTPLVEIPRM